MAYASLLMEELKSWDDFHRASQKAFGFPEFYGHNNNAWIDCLSYLDEGDGMSAFALGADEVLEVFLADFTKFSDRQPEIALGVIQLFATVNARYIERDDYPRVRLTLS